MPDSKPNEVETIRYLIQDRLRARSTMGETAIAEHLDDDTMAAFVEARLSDVEAEPVISHLVACNVCRHTTAQLVRLESEIEGISAELTEEQSGTVRTFFEDLASTITRPGINDDVVFAYQNPEETEEQPAPDQTDKEKDPNK